MNRIDYDFIFYIEYVYFIVENIVAKRELNRFIFYLLHK